MAIKKTATYGEYVINIASNNSVTVLKNGNVCDVAKAALREIAALVGFDVDAKWTTQQLGGKLVGFINKGVEVKPNAVIVETDTKAEAEVKAEEETKKLRAELEETKKALADALKQKETSKPIPPKEKTMKDGHEYVDLGLPSGVKWAACNIGADRPEEYGDYFAWAETKTKKTYTKSNSKSNDKDRDDISGSSRYDAARVNWGGSWRMPTDEEMQELIGKCTWTWTTQNGVNGYKVKGPNGNSIFLPATGYRFGLSLDYAGSSGNYWSSTPGVFFAHDAYNLHFNSDKHYMDDWQRSFGLSVRPVLE